MRKENTIGGPELMRRRGMQVFGVLVCLLLASVTPAVSGNPELSAEEKAWCADHTVVRVANEMDWPPFDYTEDGAPKGYSIDLIRKVAEKMGIQLEFVSGFTWAELVEKFKSGDIDVMPAIYESDERKAFALFTSSYFSQPSVMVVQAGDDTIQSLSALDGRKVAAIRGFMISDTLRTQFPAVDQVPVDNVVEGMTAVSMGNADAFIDSIGVVSHIAREHYIPNIRIRTDIPLKELTSPDLHMAVGKNSGLLLGILERGIRSLTEEELAGLRQKWLRLPGTAGGLQPEVDDKPSEAPKRPIPWWLLPIVIAIALGLRLLSRIADRPVTEAEMTRMSGARRLWLTVTFSNLKISAKILIILVLVATASVALFGYMNYREAKQVLRVESFNKLTAVREMKAQQIETYFDMIAGQLVTFSESRTITEAMSQFKAAYAALEGDATADHKSEAPADPELIAYYEKEFFPRLNANAGGMSTAVQALDFVPKAPRSRHLQEQYLAENPHPTGEKHKLSDCGDGSQYSEVHQVYHPIILKYLERFGFYDIFLVDHETGHIVYSVFKEVDFATSLLTGPYRKTKFAAAFRRARDAEDERFVSLEDFEPYPPSYDAPASFIASPIFEGDEKIGVLVLQMPIDRINDLMTSNQRWGEVGLGDSGETYLVGQDYLMRNQSRFLIEDRDGYLKMIRSIGLSDDTVSRIETLRTTIGLQPVRTKGTTAALAGQTNTEIFPDYRGVPVLSSYRRLIIPGVKWAIMSEIDEVEAMASATRLKNRAVMLLALFMVAITIISFVFAKTMTRPIKVLTAKANALAEGDLGVPIEIAGGDEIAQLGRSFDVMRKALAELIGGLEQKVEERTSELASKTEMLETTIESLTHPFYVINVSDHTIALSNSAAGKREGDNAGTCYALTHHRDTPCDSEKDPCPLEIVKRSKEPVVVEHVHFDGAGNPRYAEVHGYPIFDAEGNVFQMIEYSLDITERKELENALAKVTERMGKELSVGHEIQMSMLPLIFPAFPEHDEFDIFATLCPAREVGGDFYDFYFLDEDHICFTVGDVSGKGVPAALFMAVTKTLIKSRASSDFSPASIVTHVNDELSRDNESCMFVTLYVAILDLRTGEMTVSNAGHNPPLIKRRDGSVEWLKHRHGPVVGAMPGLAYGQDTVQLEREDIVLLYTDGVTEADDGSGGLFGDKRLEAFFVKAAERSPEPLIHSLRAVVLAFEGDDQADDITLLGVRYDGRSVEGAASKLSLSISNEIEEITKVIDAFEAWGEKCELPVSVVATICMVLDELLNNVITYAHTDDARHTVDIAVERVEDDVVLTVIDDGIPFNPFTSETPDTTSGIEDRAVGGLGLHLVKQMVDEVSYQRRVDQNVVKITKRIEAATP